MPHPNEDRQRCNQCGSRAYETYYCKHTDEYLCEECEAYALKMVAEEENAEFEKDNV